MEELFRWALVTALVVSLVTYILNFITSSLGIKILVALLLTAVSIIYFMRKFGLPDEGFRTGGIIGLAAMTGLVVIGVPTTDILEYILTLLLFVIAYFIGGLIGKYSLPGSEPRARKKRKEEEEEEPEEIEETEVSGE
jgi:membrane-associated HD superfamily phosphohydrolase